ncbi:MAG: hypothetical protein WC223_03105 [Bacteroidales bacterium]|jgi:hypothetical protein
MFNHLKNKIIIFLAGFILGLFIQLNWMFLACNYVLFGEKLINTVDSYLLRVTVSPLLFGILTLAIAEFLVLLIKKANQSIDLDKTYEKISLASSILFFLMIWPVFNFSVIYFIIILVLYFIFLLAPFNNEIFFHFDRIKIHINPSEKVNDKFFKILFSIGFILIFFIFFQLFISTLLYWFNITINKYYFPSSFIFSIILCFIFSKYIFNKNIILKGFILALIFSSIIIISIIISSIFYDNSFDGFLYHQDEIYYLAKGWNIIKGGAPKNAYLGGYDKSWIVDHYAKGAEIYEACVYSYFNKIEYAKCFNIILIMASFFLSFAALTKLNKVSLIFNLIISLLVSFNPVSTMQFASFYIDGQLISAIICLLSIFIIIYKNSFSLQFKLLGIFIASILVSLKFTGLVYAVIAFFAFALIFLIKKEIQKFFRISIYSIIAVIFSIGIISYHPYITNTINKHHPFYPLNTLKLLEGANPSNFKKANRFERAFMSYFSYSGGSDQSTKLKMPFDTQDKNVFSGADCFVGGFGSLYNVSIIISFILLFLIFLKSKKSKFLFYLLFFILLSSFLNADACWWARYVPQLFLIPFILIFFGLMLKDISINILSLFGLIVLIFNISFILNININSQYYLTNKVIKEIDNLKKYKIAVKFNDFQMWKIRLQEKGISYSEVDKIKLNCDYIYTLSNSFYNVFYCVLNENIIKYILFTDAEKIDKLNNNVPECGKFLVNNDITISSEKAFSGTHSIKLNETNQINPTIKICNIKKGDHFYIEAKRYKNNNNGGIVASNNDTKIFYQAQGIANKSISNEWEIVSMDFIIPENYNSDVLWVYLFNSNKTDAYFDDIKILKLKF